MTPNSIFVVTLQVIAAVLIFVITYLAIFLSIVICLVVAEFVYEGAGVVRAYTIKSDSPEHGVSPEVKRDAGESSLLRHIFRHGISGTSHFRLHKQ